MQLSELTGPEVDALDRETPFILPVVREIPRGPQIPIGIEWMILSDLLAEVIDLPIVVMPPMRFAASSRDYGLVGTYAASAQTTHTQVFEVLSAVAASGFRRVLLVTVEGELLDQCVPSLGQLRQTYPNSIVAVLPVVQIVPDLVGDVLVQLAATQVSLTPLESSPISPKGPLRFLTRRQETEPRGPRIVLSDIESAAKTRDAVAAKFAELVALLTQQPVFTETPQNPTP